MTIELPPDADALVHSKAEAAGFGRDIAAYVAHLIAKDRPNSEDQNNGDANSSRTAYDIAKEMGIIGMSDTGPDDLATNPIHMEGFGRDGIETSAD